MCTYLVKLVNICAKIPQDIRKCFKVHLLFLRWGWLMVVHSVAYWSFAKYGFLLHFTIGRDEFKHKVAQDLYWFALNLHMNCFNLYWLALTWKYLQHDNTTEKYCFLLQLTKGRNEFEQKLLNTCTHSN